MEEPPLTPLDPRYKTVMRIEALLTALPLLVGAIVIELGGWLPAGLVFVPLAVLALLLIVYLPLRRFAARGYDMGEDRLRVVKGVLFHADTVVPFSRVQHLDVEQGPLERGFNVARLVLHTAGTHNSSVTLPGLAYADAVAMREEIRAHVRRES